MAKCHDRRSECAKRDYVPWAKILYRLLLLIKKKMGINTLPGLFSGIITLLFGDYYCTWIVFGDYYVAFWG
jgi:hypothetical protein